MTRRQRRLTFISVCAVVLAISIGLILYALNGSIVFFNSPTEVVEKHFKPGTRVRIGGLVKAGSVDRGADLLVRFAITDGSHDVSVRYKGVVPDLFREGQGVVAEGMMDADTGGLAADTILAKHDERYMPKEVVDALKKTGRWQEGSGASASSGVVKQ